MTFKDGDPTNIFGTIRWLKVKLRMKFKSLKKRKMSCKKRADSWQSFKARQKDCAVTGDVRWLDTAKATRGSLYEASNLTKPVSQLTMTRFGQGSGLTIWLRPKLRRR